MLFHTEWDEATIQRAHRHLRINYRYHSNSVRVMALKQCLEEVDPSLGEAVLKEHLEKKLTL